MIYTCPVCEEKIERELPVFMDHTERHIVDEIKKKHPEWVGGDGICKKCLEYYKNSIKGEA